MRILRSVLLLVALAPAGAAAQGARLVQPAPASGGITVVGRGSAMAVPDRARVSIFLNNGNGAGARGTSLEDAANALRDDLKANGVGDAAVVYQLGNIDLQRAAPAVVGTVIKPTRERTIATAQAIVKAFPDRFAAVLTNVAIQSTLIKDECAADEARAQDAAFADARRRAEHIALTAGVRLGPVLSISAAQQDMPAGCGTKPDPVYSTANFGLGPFVNAYGPLTIPIIVNETVTFGIVQP